MHSSRPGQAASLATACLLVSAGTLLAKSNGAPSGHTGGPFPGEQSCTVCHGGSEINSGSGTLAILVDGAPASEYRYTPGETVSLIINFSDPDAQRSGFQVTARFADEGCGQAGSLAPGPSPSTSPVKMVSGSCGAGNVQWATQRRAASGSSATWDVAWTAPSEDIGPVTFAVAANGANGNASTSGDSIYQIRATVEPEAAAAPPAISDAGVVLADLRSATAKGAPNALATARGSGFAAATVVGSSGVLEAAGRVSTVLEGSCVEVNQQRAPLVRIAHDEATFQIPSAAGLGAATVQVIRGCDTPEGARSNSIAFPISAAQPVLFQFSEEDEGTSALLPDLSLAAPAADTGTLRRPALPGEVVTFLGTGFGLTAPPLETGEISPLPRRLATASIRPMIGQFEVQADHILYAGASPGFAGLYELSLRLPDNVPAGSHAFGVLVNGVASATGPKLEVGALPAPPPVTGPTTEVECAVGLVVKPGGRCTATVAGIEASFEVHATTGQGCIAAGAVSTCDASKLAANGAEASKNADGSWTLHKMPTAPPPDKPATDEPVTCNKDMVLGPGQSCNATVDTPTFGVITGRLDVDAGGNACVEALQGLIKACGMKDINANLGIIGGEVKDNGDGTWTITKLPPPPEPSP